MNPFDLRGPPFLAFYLLVSTGGLLFLYLVTKGLLTGTASMPSGDARRLLRDPYLLAYLRGGARETLRTVAFSLNQRKLLSSAGQNLLRTGNKEALQAVKHPLEQALLAQCASIRSLSRIMRSHELAQAVDDYATPLRESGLVADSAEFSRRVPAFLLIGGGLLALSVIKIHLAFQRGHSNVGFLILLTGLAMVGAWFLFKRIRTQAGDRALRDQQTLFERLRNRVHRLAADGATNEAVLVAAAFGLGVLPEAAYPFAARLHRPIPDALGSSSGGSDCSSCSSSCSSSSCGGGGGGCGGCGS